MKSIYRPGRELFAYRRTEAVLYVLAAYALWLLPALLATALWAADAGVPGWLGIIVLEFIAGFGTFAVAGIAHEGLHGTLASNPQRSAIVGALLSAPVVGFYAPGFFVLHVRHHRFVNTSSDPVAMHYTKFSGVLRRVFLARIAEGPRYFLETLRVLRRPADAGNVGESFGGLRRAAFATLAAKVVLIGAVLWLAHVAPLAVIAIILVPAAVSALVASCVPFLEHAQTVAVSAMHSARSHTSPLMILLRLGANFHLAHHLFPAIPCWRLAQVHARLAAAEPEAVAAHTDHSLVETWKTLKQRDWQIDSA